MRNGKRVSAFKGLCGSAVLGAWVAACGPVAQEETPVPVEERVQEEGAEALGNWRPPVAPEAELALSGPAVAYGGGKYLTVWRDVREGGVWGMPMRRDGDMLAPEGLRINISDEVGGGTPAIAYNGKHFVVVWGTGDGIFSVRVSPDSGVVGPVFTVVPSDEVRDPAIACSDKVCLVTFTIDGDDERVIGFRRVKRDGTVLMDSPSFLATPGEHAYASSVAWNNKEFLVVWTDDRARTGATDIYGGRVKEDGTLVGPQAGFPISTAPGAQSLPDVTWTGRRFLTVWQDERDGDSRIWGARVRKDATVDDPDGFRISPLLGTAFNPAVAHHNSKSLVVWGAGFSGAAFIGGARVGEDGSVWDPEGVELSTGAYDANLLPDVAYGGGGFLTVYLGGVDPTDPPFDVVGSRVNHALEVLDEQVLTRSFAPPAEE